MFKTTTSEAHAYHHSTRANGNHCILSLSAALQLTVIASALTEAKGYRTNTAPSNATNKL